MLDLRCQSMGETLCVHVRPCFESAARSLNLAADFISFEIVADDSPDAEEPWLHLEISGVPDTNQNRGTLFCSENAFYSFQSATSTVFPQTEVWDQARAPQEQVPFDPSLFSLKQTEKFLHHELLMALDLVQKKIIPKEIESHLVESFSAAWAVVVDGRLSRRHLPGFSLAERRARFSRLFACAGVLLPGHWNIFQSLWDGAVDSTEEVLASIRHLPRL